MQVVEESKSEAFMSAKVDDPALRREQMAVDLRKSKRQELIYKKRNPPLSVIVKELEEANRRLDQHEQRIYGLPAQEATLFDD